MNPKQKNGRDKRTGRIIVVDDDPIALKNLRSILEKEGHRVSTINNPLRALDTLEERPCDLIITDLKMPYLDGIFLLNKAKLLAPSIEVILVTGFASLDSAITAMKQGVFYYLAKPYSPEQVHALVEPARP